MDAAETARSKVRPARLVAGDPNPPREGVLRGKDGRRHFVELTSTSTRTTENEPDRIIVTGTDLTEHHHLQREILRISEQEQARIGHNLHDGIGQTMTGIAALMESLEGELDGAPRETAARIRELVRDAILEVRQMSHGLSPTAVRNRGLPGALQLLAETIRLNHRTACELAADPAIRLDNTERETHVYRIAQEAANNALRHGKPRKIKITLRREGEDECVMEISDDGTGISRQTADRPGGIGLRVMDYRANCLKGTLEVKSARGRGTTVTCRFPIQDPAARDESAASAAHESHAEAEIARDI
jgi:signal transduction histidine kinase